MQHRKHDNDADEAEIHSAIEKLTELPHETSAEIHYLIGKVGSKRMAVEGSFKKIFLALFPISDPL